MVRTGQMKIKYFDPFIDLIGERRRLNLYPIFYLIFEYGAKFPAGGLINTMHTLPETVDMTHKSYSSFAKGY